MRLRRKPSNQFLRRIKTEHTAARKTYKNIRYFRFSRVWLWTEVIATLLSLVLFIPTAAAFWVDFKDRRTQRHALAWELVTRTAEGNSGKGPALEYLNSQNIPLIGIDLGTDIKDVGTYLVGVNLAKASLQSADLSRANLVHANLVGAKLGNANLSEAYLKFADMTDADFSGTVLSGANLADAKLKNANLVLADLTNAYLRNTNLAGANLHNADLSGADVNDAKNLTQRQLDSACGDDTTSLPSGFSIKSCSQHIPAETNTQ